MLGCIGRIFRLRYLGFGVFKSWVIGRFRRRVFGFCLRGEFFSVFFFLVWGSRVLEVLGVVGGWETDRTGFILVEEGVFR